jgi:hypothetical protein
VPIAEERWQQACGEMDTRTAARVVTRMREWAATGRQLQSLRVAGHTGADSSRAAIDRVNVCVARLARYEDPLPSAPVRSSRFESRPAGLQRGGRFPAWSVHG